MATYANKADIISDENFKKRFRVALSDLARQIGASDVPSRNGGYADVYHKKRRELAEKIGNGVDNYVETFAVLAINLIDDANFDMLDQDSATGDQHLSDAIGAVWDIVAGVNAYEKPDYSGGFEPMNTILSAK